MSDEPAKDLEVLPMARIAANIYLVRGQHVMIDSDLAALYGVETKVFNQAVRRNLNRFPSDFMFQLTAEETEILRSQIVTSSSWGGRRYLPYAFTEHGVAMLSSVLRSERAVEVNIAIVRTFIKLRQLLATHAELAHRLDALEWRESERDGRVQYVFETIQHLIEAPEPEPKRQIGFPTDHAGE